MINTIALILKETILLTIFAVASLLLLGFTEIATSLFLGSTLAITNLFLIKKIMESCLTNTKQLLMIMLPMALKFPLLYIMGYLIFTAFSPISLLCGMSLVFGPLLKTAVNKVLVTSC